MAFGDYTIFRRWYRDRTTDKNMLATDSTTTLAGVITVKDANHQLFIQKISVNPTTAAAQAVLFRDSAGTPIPIAQVPVSQTNPIVFDFGPEGVALTIGKNLDIAATAGVAALIHIEAYEKIAPTGLYSNGPTQ